MSKSLRQCRRRRIAPLHGVRPLAPVLAFRQAEPGVCSYCDGVPSVVVRRGTALVTVVCPVCTPGVTL
jgi:hypothetical protein